MSPRRCGGRCSALAPEFHRSEECGGRRAEEAQLDVGVGRGPNDIDVGGHGRGRLAREWLAGHGATLSAGDVERPAASLQRSGSDAACAVLRNTLRGTTRPRLQSSERRLPGSSEGWSLKQNEMLACGLARGAWGAFSPLFWYAHTHTLGHDRRPSPCCSDLLAQSVAVLRKSICRAHIGFSWIGSRREGPSSCPGSRMQQNERWALTSGAHPADVVLHIHLSSERLGWRVVELRERQSRACPQRGVCGPASHP